MSTEATLWNEVGTPHYISSTCIKLHGIPCESYMNQVLQSWVKWLTPNLAIEGSWNFRADALALSARHCSQRAPCKKTSYQRNLVDHYGKKQQNKYKKTSKKPQKWNARPFRSRWFRPYGVPSERDPFPSHPDPTGKIQNYRYSLISNEAKLVHSDILRSFL